MNEQITITQDADGLHWVVADIKVVLCRPTGRLPTYAHGPERDNGVDLYAAEDVTVMPGESAVVPLGFKLALPPGYGFFVLPRSGLSLKTPMRVANGPGLIDHGFREEAGVIVWNSSVDRSGVELAPGVNSGKARPLQIRTGDRIAQAVLLHTPVMRFNLVDELDATGRGEGFGSSGANDHDR